MEQEINLQQCGTRNKSTTEWNNRICTSKTRKRFGNVRGFTKLSKEQYQQ